MSFFTKFIQPLFNKKCCHGNIVDDRSVKATTNNDL